MKFTEVTADRMFDRGGWWFLFARKVAEHEGDNPQDYIWEAIRGQARIFVFWGADGSPAGACATRVQLRHDGTKTGELHWQAGSGMAQWLPECLPHIEQILKRDNGVSVYRATGRTGLERALKPFGYRRRKIILEKGAGEQ